MWRYSLGLGYSSEIWFQTDGLLERWLDHKGADLVSGLLGGGIWRPVFEGYFFLDYLSAPCTPWGDKFCCASWFLARIFCLSTSPQRCGQSNHGRPELYLAHHNKITHSSPKLFYSDNFFCLSDRELSYTYSLNRPVHIWKSSVSNFIEQMPFFMWIYVTYCLWKLVRI